MGSAYLIFYQSAMVFSLLASVVVIMLIWRYRHAPGAPAMIALAIATMVWTLGFFIESNSATLEQQLFFNNIGYLGSMSVPVAWFVFALHYVSGNKPLARWQKIALCFFPLVCIVLVWSNPWHHLMWSNERLVASGPFIVTAKTYGPLFWAAVAYHYTLVAAGTIILMRRLFIGTSMYYKQAIALLVAVSLPLVWNDIYIFNLVPLPRKDLTPVMFAASGMAIAFGLMRFQFFRAVPMAHQFVIQQLSDGILVFDIFNRLVAANPAALRMAGVSREVVARELKDVAHLSSLLEQVASAEFGRADLHFTASGTESFYEMEKVPMRDDKASGVGWLAIIRDITERKRMEAERLERERKIQNAARLASLGEMAAGIAHEINNPLTPIIGFAETIMKQDLPENVRSDLRIIYDSARRTADVTRRLLTFARQNKPVRSLCSINDIVSSTIQLRAYKLRVDNIKVTTELDAALPPITADAGQLQQVFLNLLLNAEYEMSRSHKGGNLLIRTEKAGDIIRVSVKDDGLGISRENMEKLFTPFFTTKREGEGTGLGLSVCHGIVAEHGGRIYAQSEEGKGAAFIVELPIQSDQEK